MARGLAIHIGLNAVDPGRYGGWDGALSGCVPDARALRALAARRGFATTMLLDGQATAQAVLGSITDAAGALAGGDALLVTYSGHGGQIEDTADEERDGLDETWVLHDRQLLDDELYAAWGRFRSGVRILVLSDSCHSGSVTRLRFYQALYGEPATREAARAAAHAADAAQPSRFRVMPEARAQADHRANRDLYDRIQWAHPAGDRGDVAASVILISGCQDNQLSGDLPDGGVFTRALLRVWDGGRFSGGYRQFHRRIGAVMPPSQTPNLFMVGAVDRAFENQVPFTL